MDENRNPLRKTNFPQMEASEIPECEGKSRRTCMHTPRCQYFSDTCIPTPRQLVANQIHGNQEEVNRTISAISDIPIENVRKKFNDAVGKSQDDTTDHSLNQNRWFATKLISKIIKKGNDSEYPLDVDADKKWTREEKPLLKSFVEQDLVQDVCTICLEGPQDDRSLEQMGCCGLLTHEECAGGYFDTRPNAVCPACRKPRPGGPVQAGGGMNVVQIQQEEFQPDPEMHDIDDNPYIIIGNPGPTVNIDNSNGFFSFNDVSDPIISEEDLVNITHTNYTPDNNGNCVTGTLQNNQCRVDINFALMISKVCIDSDIINFGMDIRMSRYVREIYNEINNLPNSQMFRQGDTYHHIDIDIYNNDHILVLKQARSCRSLINISTTFNGGRFPKLSRTVNDGELSLLSGPVIVKNQSSSPINLDVIVQEITSSNIYSLKTNNVSSDENTLESLFELWKVSLLHDVQIQEISGPVQETIIQLANSPEWERYNQDLNDEPYSLRSVHQNSRIIQYYSNTNFLKLSNPIRERFTSS